MRIRQLAVLSFLLAACSNPQSGPDKSLAGAVLGAGWGAGAGAVVGNQLPGSPVGDGAAVGAGFGMISGLLTGGGYDLQESAMLKNGKELASLRVQNAVNAKQLEQLQARLDRSPSADIGVGVYQVFFDTDATNLKAGAIANLEVIAEAIKANPSNASVVVSGHSDDSGTPDYNERLAEARARTVTAYLAARGISTDRVQTKNFGSSHPIASNGTPEGRQLNRRVDIYLTK